MKVLDAPRGAPRCTCQGAPEKDPPTAVPQDEGGQLGARHRTGRRAAFGATNWIVGLGAGSSGEGQSANISNLTISAVASPAPTNLLYPGGTGDVVVTISNPNPYPVTITALQLPTSTTYATGYTSSALTTTQTGCLAATPSDVIWNYSTPTSGSSHTLTPRVTVGPAARPTTPWS